MDLPDQPDILMVELWLGGFLFVFLLGVVISWFILRLYQRYYAQRSVIRRRSIDSLGKSLSDSTSEVARSSRPTIKGDAAISHVFPTMPLPEEAGLVGTAREARIKGSFTAKMRQHGGKAISVKVWDMSTGGFSAEWPHKLRRGDRVWLAVGGTGSLAATVAWTHEFTIGCKFEAPLHSAVLNKIVRQSIDASD